MCDGLFGQVFPHLTGSSNRWSMSMYFVKVKLFFFFGSNEPEVRSEDEIIFLPLLKNFDIYPIKPLQFMANSYCPTWISN